MLIKILNILGYVLLPSLIISIALYYHAWDNLLFWVLAVVAVGTGAFPALGPNNRMLGWLDLLILFSFLIASPVAYRIGKYQFILADTLILVTVFAVLHDHKRLRDALKDFFQRR